MRVIIYWSWTLILVKKADMKEKLNSAKGHQVEKKILNRNLSVSQKKDKIRSHRKYKKRKGSQKESNKRVFHKITC